VMSCVSFFTVLALLQVILHGKLTLCRGFTAIRSNVRSSLLAVTIIEEGKDHRSCFTTARRSPYSYKRSFQISPKLSKDPLQEIHTSQPARIYFDIGVGGDEAIGHLVFNLSSSEQLLPLHTENIIKLSTGEMRSLDPRLGYSKCAFKHSPQFVEGFPQYRWAHVLDGRGRNAVGRPTERISDPEHLRSCTHSLYGGVYHGLNYSDVDDISEDGVVLTVPLVGAYRGSSGFSIVRVGESPQEWRERLLLNSAVIGYLESGLEVLHIMARQTDAPPTIIASGRI